MNWINRRLLLAFATVTLITFPAQVGSAAFLSYTTSTSTVAPGGSFTVTVNLVAGNSPFTFTNFDTFVGFDPNMLTPTGGTSGSFIIANPSFSTVINANYSPGVAYEQSASPTTVTVPSGNTLNPLVVFTFQTTALASGTLTFTTLPGAGGITSNFYDVTVNPDSPLAMGAPVSGSVMITGVPEPASMFLMTTGVVGLIGFRWRRKKQTTHLI